MSEKLLDRDLETNNMLKYINKPTDNSNRIIFLTGISGIGKSSLISKLSQNTKLNSVILPVKVSKSSVETIENLLYFNMFYKTVVHYSKYKKADSIPTPVQRNMKSIRYLFRFLFSILKSRMGLTDMEPLSEPVEDANIVRKKEYLLDVLKRNDIIIDIENIQNIDTQSLELLKDIIQDLRNKIFIFEYTLETTNDNNAHFMNQCKEFSEICPDISCYKIEKMDFSFAQKLAPDNIHIDMEELKSIYEKSNGNIMEIIHVNENMNIYTSNIVTKIESLSNNEKYLLFIIYLNDSPIKNDILAYIVTKNANKIPIDFEEYKTIIHLLCENKIIVNENDFLRIKHDSIIVALQQFNQSPILYSAYIALKNYYNTVSNNISSIEKLLALYIKFSDQDLLLLLPKVKEYILNMKYPDLIIEKLKCFRTNIIDSTPQGFRGIKYLTLTIVEICLEKKMGTMAQENLNLIFDNSNQYHIAIQAKIYSLQETMDAHNALCAMIHELTDGSRLKLICEICLLYLKMKLLPTEIAKKYSEDLLNNSTYRQYTEYAYLLRNYAELCDEYDKCEKLYKEAIEIFASKKMYHDMAAIYLSRSMINAYCGKINKSRHYIDTAVELDNRELSLCYILNNRSVLELLDKSYSESTEKNLKNSLLLCVSRYEKLIVNANLLIFYCLTQNFNKADTIAQFIENSNYQDFKYEEFQHIIYQNLYYFYTCFNHSIAKKQYYYNCILTLINSPNTRQATKFLASGINHLIETDYYYAQFPFRADFLGYWEFSIDSDLGY